MVSKKKREACKRNGFQVNHGNTHSKTVGNKTPRKSAQNEPVQQPNSQESPELSKTRSGSQPTVTEKKTVPTAFIMELSQMNENYKELLCKGCEKEGTIETGLPSDPEQPQN